MNLPSTHSAHSALLDGNYPRAIAEYQQLAELEPEIKSHIWHLGLALLLNEEEAEAQTAWMMGMMDGTEEAVVGWTAELITLLSEMADRQQHQGNSAIAWTLRQYIRELNPEYLENNLLLIQLSVLLESLTVDDLESYQIWDLIQNQSPLEDPRMLLETLKSLFQVIPLEKRLLELARLCAPYFEDPTDLAIVLMDQAIALGYTKGHPTLGIAYCQACLELLPNHLSVMSHLIALYQNAGRPEEGIATARQYQQLATNPAEQIRACYLLIRGLVLVGGWEEIAALADRQSELIETLLETQSDPQSTPLTEADCQCVITSTFFQPYIRDSLAQNRRTQNALMSLCQTSLHHQARSLVESFQQGFETRSLQKQTRQKLRIGYVSHCLKRHSVGWLSRWLFKHHDHDHFEIYGYFWNHHPHHPDALRDWFIEYVDTARLFEHQDYLAIAQQIFEDEIDILIDVDSVTADVALEIMALKPAPIQVTWLGWDASGLPAIDYFMADAYVVPEDADAHYSEKIWRLPNSYIAVDGFEIGVPTLTRSRLNIPSEAIVYWSGQSSSKRRPDMVRAQMQILKAVPNSYLLIKDTSDDASTEPYFQAIAAEIGVAPEQLRFLEMTQTEAEHRANLAIADVVLDTYPYNGATTTMETLWMGIPIVTRVGDTFSSRNSYTMMINAGITEGIAWSESEYIEWGIRLGHDEKLRQTIVWKLRQSRETSPLWNAKLFTQQMEAAFAQMWQMYQSQTTDDSAPSL